MNNVIESARHLAFAEHANQLHGPFPYTLHLAAVAGLVSCFTYDPDVIAAAYLHDIVEDCPDIDLEVVENMTNERVAHLVDLLTDVKGPRDVAKPLTMDRIVTDPDAVLIKLCDRYCNQRTSISQKSEYFCDMYLSELDSFLGAIRVASAMESIAVQTLYLMVSECREYMEFVTLKRA